MSGVGCRARSTAKDVKVGLISDTHGLLRPEALAALGDSELILHAGDIGSPDILKALKSVAPVIAVRGNNDSDAWAEMLKKGASGEGGAEEKVDDVTFSAIG